MHFLAVFGLVILLTILLYILSKIARKLSNLSSDSRISLRANANGHHWIIVSSFAPGFYCNVCSMAAFHGAQCDYCGIVTEECCLRKADATILCKQLAVNDEVTGDLFVDENENTAAEDQIKSSDDGLSDSPAKKQPKKAHDSPTITSASRHMQHQWVHGNLPCGSECSVCRELCGDGPGLVDQRCCWCQACVHVGCAPNFSNICTYGQCARYIVLPQCVRLKPSGRRRLLSPRHRTHVIERVDRPKFIRNWSPTLIVANPKSGNALGELVLQRFRRILNPAQVIDLSRVPPEVGLKWCTLLAEKSNDAEDGEEVEEIRVRILIAGGDGTVQWLLSAIEKLNISPCPQIGLIPLGTGNDLSRVLGSGAGFSSASDIDALRILEDYSNAIPVQLDRWAVNIEQRRRFGLPQKHKDLRMSNYLSIGVDAAVTLNFHQTRESIPRSLSSRLVNKLLFFHYGTRDTIERSCKDLTTCISLYLDGNLVELPALEGICVLNIGSWGAGVKIWDMLSEKEKSKGVPNRINDGLVEVFGLYSSFHIGQLQVGLAEPYRIGQAREVKIRIYRRHVPMQCDGEPWKQSPATICISAARELRQATMLANRDVVEELEGEIRQRETSFY